jgi:hypothetical protein
MDYCPSIGSDKYFGEPDLNCEACGGNEDRQADCEECGGVICLDCGYCPDCHEDRQFSVLPENYFWRECCHCKNAMDWSAVSCFSDAFSGEPVPVHEGCKDAAIAQNQAEYEKCSREVNW